VVSGRADREFKRRQGEGSGELNDGLSAMKDAEINGTVAWAAWTGQRSDLAEAQAADEISDGCVRPWWHRDSNKKFYLRRSRKEEC
jgi:hypothetical protein